jgi:hypothetical protein
MSIPAPDLATIEALLATADGARAGVQALRELFPRLPVTRCDASDVDTETAFRDWPHLSLFLVDGADHCWKLTTDPTRATGLVVAATRRVPGGLG